MVSDSPDTGIHVELALEVAFGLFLCLDDRVVSLFFKGTHGFDTMLGREQQNTGETRGGMAPSRFNLGGASVENVSLWGVRKCYSMCTR